MCQKTIRITLLFTCIVKQATAFLFPWLIRARGGNQSWTPSCRLKYECCLPRIVKFISVITLLLSLLLDPRLAHAQREKPVPVCPQAALAAFKPPPKLEYQCPEGQADYGEEI